MTRAGVRDVGGSRRCSWDRTWRPRRNRPRRRREQSPDVFSSRFVQRDGPGGAVLVGGGGIVMGLIRRPWTAAVVGGDRRSCTSAFLFSRGGPGGAVTDVGGEDLGLNAPVRGTSVVEETEGRGDRNS